MLERPYAKQEQLAFMISHHLGFGAVPPTVAIEGYEETICRLTPGSREVLVSNFDGSYKGVVLQEEVAPHPDLTPDRLANGAFDADQVCRAILFNIVSSLHF